MNVTTWSIGDFKIDFPNGSAQEPRWNFSIVDIPVRGGIKLAFSYRALIGFWQAGLWTVLEMDKHYRSWTPTSRKHVEHIKNWTLPTATQALRSLGIDEGAPARVLGPKDFYRELNGMLEHPRILLDMAAREAQESLRGL